MDPVSVTIARQRMDVDQRPWRRPDRGVFPIALLISVALHVLVLSLRFDVPITHRDVARTPDAIGGVAPAMRVYDIVAAEYAAPTPRAAVVQRDIEVRPTTLTEPSATSPDHQRGLTLPVAGVGGASIAGRIAPRAGDSRLWERARADIGPVDIARAHLRGEIAAYNDAAAAAAEPQRRATDWTYTDENGGRWGVSPGIIHLGRATLSACKRLVLIVDPFTCEFRVPPGRRDRHTDQLRSFNEIRQQRIRLGPTELIEERIRAIRARTDGNDDSAARVPQ